MTTNNTIPAPPVNRPRRGSGWLPESGPAWAVLGLSCAAAWFMAFAIAGMGYLMFPGCFDVCGPADAVAAHYAAAAALALTPLAAVRIFQGARPASPWARAATAVGLVVALCALAWVVESWWLS